MTKSNIEYEQIKMELEAVRKHDMMLRDRAAELSKHESDADTITVDERLAHLKDDVDPAAVNYILGQSAGYVDGIRAAIGLIVEAMASEYRDIPMTEDELGLLIELGEAKERAWLKDYKQRQITEKSGWEFDFARGCAWVKSEKSCGDWCCSECRCVVVECGPAECGVPLYKYCPQCGAKMQEVEE